MSRILLTGVTGFLGTALAQVLSEAGHAVIGVSRQPPQTADIAEWAQLDLSSTEDWTYLPNGIEVVVHCAAHVPADFGAFSEANYAWRVNGLGTLRLLQWSKERGVRQFIYCSSQAVYRRPLPYPITEEHPAYPAAQATAYALSKLAGEVYTTSFRNTALNVCSLRFSSLYGLGMKASGVIPRFVELSSAGKTIVLTAHSNTEFDLLYVYDACQAVLKLVDRFPHYTVYNVGAGTPTTLRELAEDCSGVFNPNAEPIIIERPGDDMPSRTLLDITRIRQEFDYRPMYSILAGLQAMKEKVETRL